MLLHEQYGWNPTKDSAENYYHCEDCCDKFAAHLLVPKRAVDSLKVTTAVEAHIALIECAARYDVSPAVMAKRITAYTANLGFLRGGAHVNAFKRRVIKVIWGVSSIRYLGLRRCHLEGTNPLGKMLLRKAGELSFEYLDLQELEIPNIGFAAGHRIDSYAGLANGEFILSIYSPKSEPKQLEIF